MEGQSLPIGCMSSDPAFPSNHRLSFLPTASLSPIAASSAPAVPGWGIALLVLASVLVLLCIIFIIIMVSIRLPSSHGRPDLLPISTILQSLSSSPPPQIIQLCRRKNSGYMDMFTTRGSYHSMNDYTAYQTHGRYVAPNKYEVSEGAAHGGQSSISLALIYCRGVSLLSLHSQSC